MTYIREKIEKTKLRKREKKSINKNEEKIEGRKYTIWNGERWG